MSIALAPESHGLKDPVSVDLSSQMTRMPTGPPGDLELQELREDTSTTGYKSKVKLLLLYDEIFLAISSQ